MACPTASSLSPGSHAETLASRWARSDWTGFPCPPCFPARLPDFARALGGCFFGALAFLLVMGPPFFFLSRSLGKARRENYYQSRWDRHSLPPRQIPSAREEGRQVASSPRHSRARLSVIACNWGNSGPPGRLSRQDDLLVQVLQPPRPAHG